MRTVLYTDGGTLTLKQFQSEEEMKAFLGEFLLKYQGHPDYSVDLIFEGTPSYVHDSLVYIPVKSG